MLPDDEETIKSNGMLLIASIIKKVLIIVMHINFDFFTHFSIFNMNLSFENFK
jgi:hypothetical protein